MIAGIEGMHAWTPPGADEVAVTLGQPLDLETGEPIFPWFRITRVGGLHALGAPEDNRDKRVGSPGTIARLSRRREKSVTYEGRIMAETLRQMHEGRDLLMAAFAEIAVEGRMDVRYHPDNPDFIDVPPVFYEARPLVCEVPDEQLTKNWERKFVLGLVMGDARYFDEETEAHSVVFTHTMEPKEFT